MKLLLVLALLGAPVTVPAERPPIEWHQCRLDPADAEGAALDQAGAECGELQVPLDYGQPDGPKITLALSRLKATGDRIGAMVLNDGGPGGPGLSMPLRLRPAMREAGTRYDLIGLDPRFVGRSTPIDCKLPFSGWPWAGGADRSTFERVELQVADIAARCAANAGRYLPFVNTRNTARDIDQVRIALGERKISYLGYSYGTYLGSVYLQMFPGRTDRVVLDGPLDPEQYGARLLRTAGPANEAALRGWAAWAAARDSTYHLGRTSAQVMASVDRVLRVAASRGLRIGKHRLDDGTVPVVLMVPLADDRDAARATYAGFVRTLLAATYGSVEPGPELGGLLDALLTPASSQLTSGQIAIVCGDRAVPRDRQVYWRDIQAHRRTEPHFASLTRMISPCAYWPVRPQEPPTQVANAEPALIVAADGDPRTIYPNAAALRQHLTAARLITVRNARKHGIFGEYGNDCADRTVIAYLLDGQLPADQTC
ncbi:alpha/beta hydrolase [Kribbella shirazensis]|uniref:Pimeloyl-ACP methyl ester carboxylesterase n=1 Tax=Kribbella shirazensis TaxID=1105143 RepID=A0A7X5VIB8_9ACTN|nr:alpha/beta hydrolase [Kribbella shirazensis]NIK61723.1 pimeloyl-ACP methyl ester carboxylesterase [Kribbella shirazensis]